MRTRFSSRAFKGVKVAKTKWHANVGSLEALGEFQAEGEDEAWYLGLYLSHFPEIVVNS